MHSELFQGCKGALLKTSEVKKAKHIVLGEVGRTSRLTNDKSKLQLIKNLLRLRAVLFVSIFKFEKTWTLKLSGIQSSRIEVLVLHRRVYNLNVRF